MVDAVKNSGANIAMC
jgi:T-complex protein 1 subunit epsilon